MTPTSSSIGSSVDRSSTDGSRIVGDANAERYDILTFFAQFLSVLGSFPWTREQIYLLMIYLDDLAYPLPRERGLGGTSRVVVMKSKDIIECGIYRSREPILRETIAIKMTKPSALQGGTVVDRTLLRSMATELRILSEETIRSHDNIITLLGTCWERTGANQSVLLPVFVYEASEFGDLRGWLPKNKDVTLGVQLDLCLGIARGVAFLHTAGVVHCDIKPDNILVFGQDDPACPFVPKIIDFNIAILFQDAPDRVPLPAGTSPWNSPEQMTSTFISKGDLPKVDVYSLGILILDILTIGSSKILLDYIAARGAHGVSLLDFKLSSSLALNAVFFLASFGLVSRPEGDNTNFAAFQGCWMRASLLICESLDGDLQCRTGSVSQIVDELGRLRADARGQGLLGYANPNLHIATSSAGGIRLAVNTGKYKLPAPNW